MPTVNVGRDKLIASLQRNYTQQELEKLCSKIGIVLSDATTEKEIIREEKHLDADEVTGEEEIIYNIEVSEDRCDLLCFEGIVQALRVFIGLDHVPDYKLADVKDECRLKVHVKPETSPVRPYIVCAVLRDITFDDARYNSFMDLQDKLHEGVCRMRSLVAIGTHDLDKIEGPFTYEALSPRDIYFMPLKHDKDFRADELVELYKTDQKLKKFLPIIEGFSVYPVIYDRRRTVLSLPPIINGDHSSITLNTKNVFIECTATDLTLAMIVLNTMVTTFSVYCARKFEVEPVEVIYGDGKSSVFPDLSVYHMSLPLKLIEDTLGIHLEENEVISYLDKTQMKAEKSNAQEEAICFTVSVPPNRRDIRHAGHIAMGVALAHGFDKIALKKPASSKPVRMRVMADLIKSEIALAGYTEVIRHKLCSFKDMFSMLNRKDDKSRAVFMTKPVSNDFQVARNSLMPGLLKAAAENEGHPEPTMIFEVGDIWLPAETKDGGATKRCLFAAALYGGATSGFEKIHGLVDKFMNVIGAPFVVKGDNSGYYLEPANEDPEFFEKRRCSIIYKGKRIGAFGIVHPVVLENFAIRSPCSFVEIDLENYT